MFVNETASSATARDSYESFDCSEAVALIGFIGLLSNFQSIIDYYVKNGRRRRRKDVNSDIPLTADLSSAHWEDIIQIVLKSLQWTGETADEPQEEEEDNIGKDMTRKAERNNEDGADETRDTIRVENVMASAIPDREMEPLEHLTAAETDDINHDLGSSSSILQDFAHIGPQMAMWLVDLGDGRVSSEEGRAGVCRAANALTKHHGWLGSIAAKLLMRTFVGALAKDEPTRSLLQEAGVAMGTPTCPGSS
ncbi:uncharacterized protein [Procambarus clarkii]|uniref:uncharacterized protein n=1 Tax=Procambarus clarkii TaxID=6728 RepID=UPI003744958B